MALFGICNHNVGNYLGPYSTLRPGFRQGGGYLRALLVVCEKASEYINT